jgi:radical SAM protein with 4Fe4S-binding SPASM domain
MAQAGDAPLSPLTPRRGLRATRAVNDGNGFVFIDHTGAICPSGFLPMPRGNVRAGELVNVYRNDALFLQLRDPDALHGRCGRCEFRAICGGSRSRAFAQTGSALATDPLCAYEPDASVAEASPLTSVHVV